MFIKEIGENAHPIKPFALYYYIFRPGTKLSAPQRKKDKSTRLLFPIQVYLFYNNAVDIYLKANKLFLSIEFDIKLWNAFIFSANTKGEFEKKKFFSIYDPFSISLYTWAIPAKVRQIIYCVVVHWYNWYSSLKFVSWILLHSLT